MDWSECDLVEVIPENVFGVPILKHSRVLADAVLESHESGEFVDEIAYSYSLAPDEVRTVLSLAGVAVSAQTGVNKS